MQNGKAIKAADGPREQIQSRGPGALRDRELLAAILGSGGKTNDVHALSRKVLALINQRNGNLTHQDLVAIPGVGSAKAATILAAFELARRRLGPCGKKIATATDVIPLLSPWASAPQEHFLALTLNGAHEVLKLRVITVGLANTSQVHPREVFADAISDRACAIILAHNHPSGNLTPSVADKSVTRQLTDAGLLLGIAVLDHIIISTRGYYSFQEAGILGGMEQHPSSLTGKLFL